MMGGPLHDQPSEALLSERLQADVPLTLAVLTRAAANERGTTIADFVRTAVAERLERDGVRVPDLPILRRARP